MDSDNKGNNRDTKAVSIKETFDNRQFLTGNEYISLPEILPGRGGIVSAGLIHCGNAGLLEFTGTKSNPLLEPVITVNHRKVNLKGILAWSYRDHWLPCFYGKWEQGEISGKIVCPPGHRGCFYQLTLRNLSRERWFLEWGWQGTWSKLFHTASGRSELKDKHPVYTDDDHRTLILDARSGAPLAALALCPSLSERWVIRKRKNRASLSWDFCLLSRRHLEPNRDITVTLYIAASRNASGASAIAADLQRRETKALEQETRFWLQQRHISHKNPSLERVMRRNLFFSYFYSLGRSIDNDTLVCTTSRSPHYYKNAAFSERDSLLWSFPAVLMIDPKTAREVLIAVFSRHTKKAGEYLQYVNGTLLYPGFALDQLVAYFIALKFYMEKTRDNNFIRDVNIGSGLKQLITKTSEWYDPVTGLYKTTLDPSGEPAGYPFLIFNNALLQQSFEFLGSLQAKGWGLEFEGFYNKSALLREAIKNNGIVEGPCGPMFAWSVDGCGNHHLYDTPSGSLQLLAYYGFCSHSDKVFVNTVKWIRSAHNAFYHTDKPLGEAGSMHATGPWPLGAANDLLALNEGKGEMLKHAQMDNGFCCESIDPETGKAVTGKAFASAAGFLAYSLRGKV